MYDYDGRLKSVTLLCIPSWFLLGLSLLTNSTVQYVCTYLLCSLKNWGREHNYSRRIIESVPHLFPGLNFVVGLKYCWAQMIVITRQRQISSRAITLLFMVEFRYCLEQLICRAHNSGCYLQGHRATLV